MLNGFKEYLLKNGSVKSQYIPFYLKCVASCYSFLDVPDSTRIDSDRKKQFLTHMAKTHEDWQVKQADAALRLYQYFLAQSHKKSQLEVSAGSQWRGLEDKTRESLRLRHRSYSTEKTYITWLHSSRNFIKDRSPEQITGRNLQDFLSSLAVEKRVSPSTQNQALNVIVFFFRHVLEKNIDGEISAVRARQRRHLPVVLTVKEIQNIFDPMSGTPKLMAMITYGCGLWLQECLSLMIKDIDFEQNVVIVRSGKGDNDRRTVLPESLKDLLIEHCATVRSVYEKDRERNLGGVSLPGALEKNILMLDKSGGGSGFSLRNRLPLILVLIQYGFITCIWRPYRKRLNLPSYRQALRNRHRCILCGTVLPPTCWKTDMTSEQFRSCLGMRTSKPP